MFVERRHFGRNLTNINDASGAQGRKGVATKAAQQQKPAAPVQFAVFCDNQNQQPTAPWQYDALPMPEPIVYEDSDPMCIEDDAEVEDIDELDACDPQFVSEYVNDIVAFLKEKEKHCRIPADFLAHQKEVTGKHRDVLVAWMAKAYRELRLLSETLFLAVDIVDRVLASGPVSRKKVHLLGCAALIIASKYEETFAPPLEDFHEVSGRTFTDDDFIKMEKVLLNRIGFNLCIPASVQFLRRYSKAARSDSKTHTLSKYLTELSMTSHTMVGFLPSEIAAAAVLLARNMRGVPAKNLWNATLAYYSGYEQYDIMTCARALNKVLYNELMKTNKNSIFLKYQSKNLLAVALVPFRDL
mmetsp:Transcript_17831/g.69136  ORF Transcript_17831/g.69136 Transcript_17831/m.69136 type:complete len:356 (+) Transcript_17831:123-1190(+)